MATSKVEVVVLGLLAEEPLYGYDLLERFRSRSMGFWVEVGKASVYQTLRRLERDGSVGGRSQDGPEGPDRRVYRITRAGQGTVEARPLRSGRPRSSRTRRTAGWRSASSTCSRPPTRARSWTNARRPSATCWTPSRPSGPARPPTRAPAASVSTAMLDRQTAFAKAELAWIKAFRSELGRIRRSGGGPGDVPAGTSSERQVGRGWCRGPSIGCDDDGSGVLRPG